jgi:UDP-2-acetamido-3-amino-2,3-dideoxy-glucuronate N-acetyltransferase
MSNRNLALIGAGYWGKNLARNFHALGALHTLADLSQPILDSYGAEYDGVRKTRDIDALWRDAAITRVAIAAPAVLHHRLAKAALLAGKDVFVEKPLCLDLGEARELIALAREKGRILMVGHLLQYHPMVRHLQELVATGQLGPVYHITSNRLNLGKIRREENSLWSFAPHDLSVILSLAGGALPGQVRCTGGAYLTPGVADTTLTTLAFPGGLRAQVYVSWLNPFKEQKLTVVGEKAMAVFDDTRPWAEKLALYRNYLRREGDAVPAPNKLVPEYAVVPEAEPLRAECAHFLQSCDDRSAPRTDGAEGERVLRVLHAAQASLERDGEAMTLSSS